MGSAEERKQALERLRIRAELRSAGDEEDSQVIEQQAISRRPKSDPAPVRGLVAILNTLPPWGRVLVVLALLAVVASGGLAAKVAGWF